MAQVIRSCLNNSESKPKSVFKHHQRNSLLILSHVGTKIPFPERTALSQHKNLLLHLLHITSFWTGKLKQNKTKLSSTFLLYSQNTKNHVSFCQSVGDCLCLVWHSTSLAWKAMNSNRNLHIKWQNGKSSLIFFSLAFILFRFLEGTQDSLAS